MTDLRWYAVKVRPNQARVRHREYTGEPGLAPFRVEHELRRRGFETFVPKRTAYRLSNRYSKQKELRAYPLLVGWVFVGWPADANRWRDLTDTPGVVAVIGNAARPLPIAAARIALLQARWEDHTLLEHREREAREAERRAGIARQQERDTIRAHRRERFMRSGKEYAPGQHVRVMGGPFDQAVCKVVEIRGAEAKVLLTLFGTSREVAIEAMLLEAAE